VADETANAPGNERDRGVENLLVDQPGLELEVGQGLDVVGPGLGVGAGEAAEPRAEPAVGQIDLGVCLAAPVEEGPGVQGRGWCTHWFCSRVLRDRTRRPYPGPGAPNALVPWNESGPGRTAARIRPNSPPIDDGQAPPRVGLVRNPLLGVG